MQLSQEENVKNLRLHLETYLAQAHFRKMETTRNYPHQNVLATQTQVTTLHKKQTNNTQTNLDLEYNSGVWLPPPTKKS
jgi:hypothetical protein